MKTFKSVLSELSLTDTVNELVTALSIAKIKDTEFSDCDLKLTTLSCEYCNGDCAGDCAVRCYGCVGNCEGFNQ